VTGRRTERGGGRGRRSEGHEEADERRIHDSFFVRQAAWVVRNRESERRRVGDGMRGGRWPREPDAVTGTMYTMCVLVQHACKGVRGTPLVHFSLAARQFDVSRSRLSACRLSACMWLRDALRQLGRLRSRTASRLVLGTCALHGVRELTRSADIR